MRKLRDLSAVKRPTVALAAACLLLAGGGAALHGQEEAAPERSSLETLMDQTSAGNTVQAARALYHQGMRELDRAGDLADKATATDDPAKSEKLLGKSTNAYESASQLLMQALQGNPKMIEGYDALGFAYRRLGNYQAALEVHAIALRRDPESMENFRGWSEALLKLDMLGNATQAYTSYAEDDSPRASILMDEMRKWLAAKQADPGDLDPADVERLADWIAQQEQSG